MSYRTNAFLFIVTFLCICLLVNSTTTFQNGMSKVQNFVSVIRQRVSLSSSMHRESKRNFSNPCFEQMYHFIFAFLRKEYWTFKMIDASSKIQPGMLVGNRIDLGMYDECLSVNQNNEEFNIKGRHCMYTLNTKILPINLLHSICVPSKCNSTDINHILNLVIFNMTNIHEIGITSLRTTCSRTDTLNWSTGSIIVLSCIAVYFVLLFLCTLVEYFFRNKNLENRFMEILSSFSLRRSALKILNTRVNPASFPVLNGIRVLSIVWVVLGHGYVTQGKTVVNMLEMFEWFKNWDSLYMNLAPFSVDSFFVMSGFLMTFIFLKKVSKGERINILKYYLHRYLRLTPAVGMLLLMTIFIVPHIGSGPLHEKSEIYSDCDQCWWTILLYLQNFINTKFMCLDHLWYLAVDMQLFWFSPVILYPLAKKPRIGLYILFATFVATIITTGTIIAVNKYSYDLIAPNNLEMVEFVYKKPYARAGPWLVGIFFGYVSGLEHIRLTKKRELIGWLGSVACFAFCILGVRYSQRKEYEYSLVWEIIFGSVVRPIWGCGLCWIIFTSVKGHGGPVNKFLSLPIFLPLAKLSYCIYLVHITLQMLIISSSRVNTYFSDFQFASDSISQFILSIPFAFLYSILFESPILILEKMILETKRTK